MQALKLIAASQAANQRAALRIKRYLGLAVLESLQLRIQGARSQFKLIRMAWGGVQTVTLEHLKAAVICGLASLRARGVAV